MNAANNQPLLCESANLIQPIIPKGMEDISAWMVSIAKYAKANISDFVVFGARSAAMIMEKAVLVENIPLQSYTLEHINDQYADVALQPFQIINLSTSVPVEPGRTSDYSYYDLCGCAKCYLKEYDFAFYTIRLEDRTSFIDHFCIVVHTDVKDKTIQILTELFNQSVCDTQEPVLEPAMIKDIYDNSIGFLLDSKENTSLYAKYDIPRRRGIILAGKPGNGKSLTCKWIRSLCKRNGFSHKIITMSDFDNAFNNCSTSTLFKFSENKSGVIFFDDMDMMVKNRKNFDVRQLGTFLSELDGINSPTNGVVYIFTTNYLQELDPAFVRPGRIDRFIVMNGPTPDLRRAFFQNRLHQDIRDLIDIEYVVTETDEYSFAELEEIRKAMCIEFIHTQSVQVDNILRDYRKNRDDFLEQSKIGFASIQADESTDRDCPAPYRPY